MTTSAVNGAMKNLEWMGRTKGIPKADLNKPIYLNHMLQGAITPAAYDWFKYCEEKNSF